MRSGRRVFFVVMGNVFPIDRPVHERYDLKGSTRNRFTTDEERQAFTTLPPPHPHPPTQNAP